MNELWCCSPDRLAVKRQLRLGEQPEGVKLKAKGTFASDELSCVGPVQTVNTINPQHTSLVPPHTALVIATPTNSQVTARTDRQKRASKKLLLRSQVINN